MAVFICITAALLVAVSAAAPPVPPRFYQGPGNPNFQPGLEQYYLDNAEVANYYSQAQQKQGQVNANAPARLENLEPDSEVELVPGVQQPQQPPQQNPVSPNLPGLVPGQRVFIVHMPVAGYRPGTVGGYQPLYIVAAAPQGGNAAGGYAANGYQNAILLDPSGQAVLSPVNGYYRPGLGPQQGNPGLLLGAPIGLQRPFDLAYQDPNLAYQQVGPQGPGPEGQQIRLAVPFRQTPAANTATNANQSAAPAQQKRVGQSAESSELKEEPKRNAIPAQAQPPRKP
ncbi:uncharacterized protein LOC125226111 [Leguminivora glycinivorella]|uniref:uncharacterized protein LOC125226111 n=1 Tax=Leguminivora glycinivorella TaxID=1035111 RepID=UPI00200C1EFE|nr:uncharacterized protein LOC125226111 [Leguminivora glycinivorella]